MKKGGIFFIVLALLVLPSLVSATPTFNFVSPTPTNNSIVEYYPPYFPSANYAIINITISEQNLSSFIFNWDGNNNSFYDKTLMRAYNFDNNSELGENRTTLYDFSFQKRNATCNINQCPQNNISGRYSWALNFDGNDDYIELDNDASLKSPVGTISFWIKLNSDVLGQNMQILNLYEDLYNDYFMIYKDTNDGIVVRIYDGGVSQVLLMGGNIDIGDTEWHHVMVTQDGTRVKIFIDGKEGTTNGQNSNYWSDFLTISSCKFGGGGWGSFKNLSGMIDELRIYNVSLRANETIACEGYGADVYTAEPIGGGSGYSDIIDPSDADYYVDTRTELLNALSSATSGQIIYIEDDAEINVTNTTLQIYNKDNITIASGRGNGSSRGGLLYINQSGQQDNIFHIVNSDDVRITGIHIRGACNYSEDTDCTVFTNPVGIDLWGTDNLEIDNCEIEGLQTGMVQWVYANGTLHHSYLHNNEGYPNIIARNSYPIFEANVFDFVQQIGGSGDPKASYEVRYNIFNHGYSKARYMVADMHGSWEHEDNDVMIGLWRFNEGSGTSTEDTTTASLDGTLTNMSTPGCWVNISAFAHYSYALQFDGVDDYIDFGNSANFGLTSQVTLEAWVNASDPKTNGGIIAIKGTFSDPAYYLYLNENDDQIYFSIGNANVTWPIPDEMNGSWHHLAGTYNGTALKIWYDGEVKNTSYYSGSIRTSSSGFTVGAQAAGGYAFQGMIDEVMLYNDERSTALYTYIAMHAQGYTAIAGEQIIAHHNTFNLRHNTTGIAIKGLPTDRSLVYKNKFFGNPISHELVGQDAFYLLGETAQLRDMHGVFGYDNCYIPRHHLYSGNIKKINSTTWNFYYNASQLANKNYTYYAWANDTSNNVNLTNVRTIRPINYLHPNVTLVSPGNGTSDEDGTVIFNCSGQDGIRIENMTLYVWHNNGSLYFKNTTNVTGWDYGWDLSKSWNLTLLPGTYLWTCQATNWGNYSDFAGTNYSLTYSTSADSTPPVLNFVPPTPPLNDSYFPGPFGNFSEINISIIEENLSSFIFNWEGTNYSFYDGDLVLGYNLDNVSILGENSTLAYDFSRHENNGTIIGAEYVPGIYGNALFFDGDNDEVSCGQGDEFKSGIGTISFWYKPNRINSNEDLIKIYNDSSGNLLAITKGGWNYDKIMVYVRENGVDVASGESSASAEIEDTEWHQIIVTQNGTCIRIFVDDITNDVGSCINTTYWTDHLLGTVSCRIGRGWNSDLNGTIDEVRIYNKVWTNSTPSCDGYGAEVYTAEPIGGGSGYSDIIDPGDADYYVDTRTELLSALSSATSGEIVYVEDDAEIDLSSDSGIAIPAGVTLASGRGNGSSLGGLLYSNGTSSSWLFTLEDNVRVTGIRLGGNLGGSTRCLEASSDDNVEIDNCEFWNWGYGSVAISWASNGSYHHNYAHDGGYYGIVVARQDVLVEANKFERIRHSIASGGEVGTRYIARYNLCLNSSEPTQHTFDMHGYWENYETSRQGYWRFDEGQGSTVADNSDYPGQGSNTGALRNVDTGTCWGINSSSYEHFKHAINFDGSDDYMEVAHSSTLNINNIIVLEAFFNTTVVPEDNNQVILVKGTISSPAYYLYLNGDTDTIDFSVGNAMISWDMPVGMQNSWHHVLGMYNGTGLSLYYDGVVRNSSSYSGSIATNSQNLTVGAEAGGSRAFQGMIDEVLVLNRTLNVQSYENEPHLHSIGLANMGGERMQVYYNTFYNTRGNAFLERGLPADRALFYRNKLYHDNASFAASQYMIESGRFYSYDNCYTIYPFFSNNNFRRVNNVAWEFYFKIYKFAEGNYTYYAWANDTSNNGGSTGSLTLKNKNYLSPGVSLRTPGNASSDSDGVVNFSCNAESNLFVENMTLYIWNATGIYHINKTNISGNMNEDHWNDFSTYIVNTSWNITLPQGTYSWNCLGYNVGYNSDWADSNNTLSVNVTADSTAPYFISISNQSISVNQSVATDFDADDETAFDCFSVNDTTRFSINCSGYFENVSFLVEGIYFVNVTINDTSNNLNWTIIFVNVSSIGAPQTTEFTITLHDPGNDTWLNLWLFNMSFRIIGEGETHNASSYFASGLGSDFQFNHSKIVNNGTFSSLSVLDSYFWVEDDDYRWYINTTNGTTTNQSEIRTLHIDRISPLVNFTSPTLANGSSTGNDWIYVNITLSDDRTSQNLSALIDFNGSLVAWYPLEFYIQYPSNSSDAGDISGHRNNGTLYNMNTGLDNNSISGWTSSGRFGNALKFDGIDDYINASNGTAIDGFNFDEGTYELWIKPNFDNTSTDNHIFIDMDESQVSTRNKISFYYRGGAYNEIRIEMIDKNGTEWYDSNVIPQWQIGEWAHVVATWSETNNETQIYVNGHLEEARAYTGDINDSSSYLRIGQSIVGIGPGGGWFNGTMDEIRVWGRVLSPEEINASYNAGIYRLYHNFTNLSEGTYGIKAYVVDHAGNVNMTENRSVTYTTSDTESPYFTNIANISIYDNQSVSYDVNASDAGVGLDCFSVNDTTRFSINCSGNLANTTNLSIMQYWLNITVNDTNNNFNYTIIFVNVSNSSQPMPDTTKPYFTYIINQSIYDNQSIGVDFDADDETAFDCFSLNDSLHFLINCSGYFRNISALSTQIYWVNITINDTSNNLNSTVIYVNVSAGVPADTTKPYFTYIANFTIYDNVSVSADFNASDETAFDCFALNDTSHFSINCSGYFRNISALAYTRYWLNVTINDTSNNVNSTVMFVNVTGTGALDTNAPYFINITNISIYSNASIVADFDADDDVAFNCFNVNDSRFNINCSGYMVNTSSLAGGRYWLNISITDASNNLNHTIIFVNITSISGPSNFAPEITLGEPEIGTIFYVTYVNFSFTVTDEENSSMQCRLVLDGVINKTNNNTANNSLTWFAVTGFEYASHNWAVNCSDGITTSQSSTRNFAVSVYTPPGNGGGGGGGGGAIPKSGTGAGKKHCWDELFSGQRVAMLVDNFDVGVKELLFDMKSNVSGGVRCIEVVQIKEVLGSGIMEYDDPVKVYKYFIINNTGIYSDDIEEVKIDFSVAKSWLINHSQETVYLYRYTSQWDKLNTSFVYEDINYSYFSAVSPGFSDFVVIAEPKTEPVVQEEEEIIGEITEETPGLVVSPTAWVMIVVLAIVIAYIVYYISNQRRYYKEEKEAKERGKKKKEEDEEEEEEI